MALSPPRPDIPAGAKQVAADATSATPQQNWRSRATHTPHAPHLHDKDRHRHDCLSLDAAKLAVEASKISGRDTSDNAIMELADKLLKFLKAAP